MAPSNHLLELVERKATDLAIRDPAAALAFLESEAVGSRSIPDTILAGVGDGISSSLTSFSESVVRLPDEVLLRLIAISRQFAHHLIADAKLRASRWIPHIKELLWRADREVRERVAARLIPLFDDGALAPLMPPLLDGISSRALVDVAIQIGDNTGFRFSEFDEPLGNAARDEDSLHALRNEIVNHFGDSGADRFLFSTLRLDTADIAWVCAIPDAGRGRRLLIQLLEATSERDLLAVQRDWNTRDRILDLLLGGVTQSAYQIARVLAIGEMQIEPLLDVGERVLPYLESGAREPLEAHLVKRALAEAAPGDPRVPMLMEQAAARLDPRQVLRMATVKSATPARVAENIVLLEHTPHLRQRISEHVDELSERIIGRGPGNLGGAAYEAWARMIAAATQWEVKFRASSSTLTFALHSTKLPVSSLIVVTFPMVYAELLRSKEGDEVRVPAFLALPMSFFVDWDRVKSARHDLIDAFLHSNLPPAALLLTAVNAGIGEAALERLSRSSSGRQYINAIENDVTRLDEAPRHQVEGSLKAFFDSNRASR